MTAEPGIPIPNRLRLPTMWAGFQPADTKRIQGEGPELLGEIHNTGCGAEELMREQRLDHDGLTLFPLPWVSHHWERFRAVFVDLGDFPIYQVFEMSDPAKDLSGFRAACEFDFLDSPFRENSVSHLVRNPKKPAQT